MPSDLAKKKAAKKKEAAKARQRPKKSEEVEVNGDCEQQECQENEADSNGERKIWIKSVYSNPIYIIKMGDMLICVGKK